MDRFRDLIIFYIIGHRPLEQWFNAMPKGEGCFIFHSTFLKVVTKQEQLTNYHLLMLRYLLYLTKPSQLANGTDPGQSDRTRLVEDASGGRGEVL